MYNEQKQPPLFAVVASVLVAIMLLLAWSSKQSVDAFNHSIIDLKQEGFDLQRAITDLAAQSEALKLEVYGLQETLAGLEAEIEFLRKRVVYMPQKRTVYLTFDDGPSQNTAAILNILSRYGVKATFFVAGNGSEFGRNMYRRIVEEGHALGNHTYSHDYARIYTSPEAYWADHMRLEELLYEAAGVRPQILRFPGGSNNTVSLKYGGADIMDSLTEMALEKGYYYIDWNVTSQDAAVPTQDVDVIIETVLSRVRTVVNPIILFHDNSAKTTTVEALPVIIESLLDLGFSFDVLSPTSYSIRFTK